MRTRREMVEKTKKRELKGGDDEGECKEEGGN